MQIILQEDVEKLGTRGEVVEVAAGYARNYLLPHKLALEASPANIKRLEKIRITLSKRTATEKDAAEQQAACLMTSPSSSRAKPAKTISYLARSLPPIWPMRSPRKASRSTSAASRSMSPSKSSANRLSP